ncbi:MAG: 2-oxoglutarate dehydrogenase, E2 component, dihydrolipoamide succinyltransferase [Deltaproteobacteria bacterium]|nr:2-oxoglutarate dehydrogenase, E2 component, dihydrolipoamide succinyltransferase [Deltaproteobacteria bacterium]
MADKIVMPQLGESIAEGTIVKWLKKPGDVVKKDENILLISTDKVEAEIPSPAAGTLLSTDVAEGATVAVGTVLGFVGAAGETVKANGAAGAPAPAPPPAAAATTAKAPPPPPAAAAPAAAAAAPAAAAPAPAAGGSTAGASKVVMPQLGESIAEGTIVKWLKKPGDVVKKDENILLISTDKVEAEIPSPAAGTLINIAVAEGQTVAVGTVLGYVGAAGSAVVASAPAAGPAPTATATAAPAATANVELPRTAPSSSDGRFVSPLVRKIAMDNAINDGELNALAGTGNNGRVTKKDLLDYVEAKKSGKVQAPPAATTTTAAPPAAAAAGAAAPPAAARPSVFAGPDRTVIKPASSMRKVIMKNMVESKRTSAHVHTFFDVDYSAIERVRRQHKNKFEAEEGVKLSYTVFIAAAVAQTLKRHEYINAEIRGTDLVFKKDVHLGMAVAIDTPEPGLMVPVIKNADQMNLRGLARGIADLASRVRSRKIKPDELSGSSFTITNPGNYGAIIGTPVINQPNLAILGVGRIQKEVRVMEIDGADTIAIRLMGILSLGFDHRLIDGAAADTFMADLKKTLETWDIAP